MKKLKFTEQQSTRRAERRSTRSRCEICPVSSPLRRWNLPRLRTLRTISESQSAVVRRSDSGFGDSGAG